MTEKKHMSKKELQEDPFFEEVAHIVSFFQNHKNAIYIAVLVLLVIATGIIMTGNITKKNNVAASGYFGIAMDNYSKGNMEQAEEYFLLTSQEFSKNVWGTKATFYLGMINQDSEEGIEYLEGFVGSDSKEDIMKATAYQVLASKAVSDGDFAVAGDYYLQAAANTIGNDSKVAYVVKSIKAFSEIKDSESIDKVVSFARELELDKTSMDRIIAVAL